MSTPIDTRIAVVGRVDSGKSSLIGYLVYGQQDDGRGLARSKVLKFKHEKDCGRTSTITHHLMGFDEKGEPIHQSYPASANPLNKNKSWEYVMSHSDHTVTFIDLAGHEKYLKTTVCGMSGCFPHYICIVVGANMGISKMTREHIGLAILLNIPFYVVINKIDLAPENILKQTLKDLSKLLKNSTCNKTLYLVKKSKDLATIDKSTSRVCPVFLVSTLNGTNIPLLYKYIKQLTPPEPEHSESDQVIMEIDDTFNVVGIGLVVSGTVHSGTIKVHDQLKIGPLVNGAYRSISVKSIHIKRVPVTSVRAGTVCTVAIRNNEKRVNLTRDIIRKGMFIVEQEHTPCMRFIAEIFILYHTSIIKDRFQAVAHCGSICQTVQIELEEDMVLRSGDKAIVKIQFMSRPEYITEGSSIILRESSTKAYGKVLSVLV